MTPAPTYGIGDASYQAAGGIAGLQRLVADFYRLMDKQPEAADLRPVLDLVAGDFTRAGADLRLTLPDAPMLSQMDPDAAAIIARNLFENALRHGTGAVTAAL